jgi:ADP-ribose pyrophosphatase YjhB (NUDIX family)
MGTDTADGLVVRERPAARGLLVTPARELLLMQMAFPWNAAPIWIAPGGGLEANETWEEALVRELREETGFALPFTCQEIGQRTLDVAATDGNITRLRERYFLIRAERFEPDTSAHGSFEQTTFRKFRWWPLDEIATCDAVENGATLHTLIVRALG